MSTEASTNDGWTAKKVKFTQGANIDSAKSDIASINIQKLMIGGNSHVRKKFVCH